MTPIRRFAATARRLWWLPAMCVVVGLALALGASLTQGATATASTQVLVPPGGAITIADAQLIAQSDAFDRRAAAGLRVSYRDLQAKTTVSTPPGTNALEFTVVAPTGHEAALYANSLASAFVSYYAGFVHSSGLGDTSQGARLVSPALSATTSSSSAAKDGAIGIFGGLAVAAFVLGLIESQDRTLRIPVEVEDLLGARPMVLPVDPAGQQAAMARLAGRVTDARGVQALSAVVVSVGATSQPAIAVANRLADQLAANGGRPVVRKLNPPGRRGQRPERVTLFTANGADTSPGSLDDLPIGLWVVVVHLGRSTATDIEQAQLLLSGYRHTPTVWVTVSDLDLLPSQRRVKPLRPA